jgi:hypothetical protein
VIDVLKRLVAARIQLLPDTGIATHFVFERDGFAALVQRREEGFGGVGAPGLMTERGLAFLVWRAGEAWFVRKGWEVRATREQVTAMNSFATDLEAALKT